MTTVLIAGATGMLGSRLAHHLARASEVRDGGELRLLVRPDALADPRRNSTIDALTTAGAVVVEGDLADDDSLDPAVKGVDVVLSAVQGGREVMVDGQVALARAAEQHGVRRFVASDFAIDLFKAPAGAPMFATRRRAAELLDDLDLDIRHVLTGGFLDLMLNPAYPGFVDHDRGTVTFWGDGTEPFDMTTVEDTARLTTRIVLDDTAAPPADGVHRFSAVTTTMHGIADELERVAGRPFARQSLGGLTELRRAIDDAQDPGAAIGLWYQLALASTPPLADPENARYPEIALTTLGDHLAAAYR